MQVHEYEVGSLAGPIPCWAYTTHGLWDHGQKEVVLVVKRRKRESPLATSAEVVAYFRILHQLAAGGSLVDVGGHSEFRVDFLGFRGVLYFRPSNLHGLPLPEHVLLAILVTEAELRVAREFGATRVASRLGKRRRHYPLPPWSERGRNAVSLPELSGESVLCKAPRLLVSGASVVAEGSRLSLHLSSPAGALIRSQLETLPLDQALAIPLEVDPQSNGCLVWEGPRQREPFAISPEGSDGSKLSGAFLLFVPGNEDGDEWRMIEDGYGVMLTTHSWTRLREAIEDGSPLELGSSEGAPEFSLEWVGEDYRDRWGVRLAEPEGSVRHDPSRTTRLRETVLLANDAELERRLEGVEPLADYLRGVEERVEDHFSAAPVCPGNDLLIGVELRPTQPAELSIATRPGVPAEVLEGLLDRLSSVASPSVREGPVAFQLLFALWGGSEEADS